MWRKYRCIRWPLKIEGRIHHIKDFKVYIAILNYCCYYFLSGSRRMATGHEIICHVNISGENDREYPCTDNYDIDQWVMALWFGWVLYKTRVVTVRLMTVKCRTQVYTSHPHVCTTLLLGYKSRLAGVNIFCYDIFGFFLLNINKSAFSAKVKTAITYEECIILNSIRRVWYFYEKPAGFKESISTYP